MEAMACGCLTIGYDGRGGAEYMKEPFATPIPPEDVPRFAAATEHAMRAIQSHPAEVLERTRRASQFIHDSYSPEIEARDILATWKQIESVLNTPRTK